MGEGQIDYVYWQTQDKRTLKRINKLIMDSQRSPFSGLGQPESLMEHLSGFGREELMIRTGLSTQLIKIKSRSLLLVAILANNVTRLNRVS